MLNILSLRQTAFGLAISDNALRVALLKKKGKFLSLLSWQESEIKEGVIDDGEIKNEEEVVKTIQQVLQNVKGRPIKTRNIIASLPERNSFLQVIQMPRMKREELREAVNFEAENYIPLPLAEVYLDFEIVSPVKNHLDHFDVLIVASPKKIVDSYMSCFKKAGLSALALEIESQSMARALVKNQISPFPVLLLDFSEDNSTLNIFSGNSLRLTSSIPIGSANLTKAVAKNIGIGLLEAEKLKAKYGLKIPKKQGSQISSEKSGYQEKLFEAMVPVLTDFVEGIRKYLGYHETHRSHEHLKSRVDIDKIILAGSGASLKGFDDFLSFALGIAVEIGNPWINILQEPLKEVPGLSFYDSLGYTSALGLALRAMKFSEI